MSQQVRRSTRLQLKEQQAEEEGKRREPPSAAEEAEIAAPKRQPAKPKAPPSRKRSASAKKQEQEDAAMQAQSEEEEEQAPPAKKGKKGAATKQKKGKKASSKIAVEDLVAAEGGELPKPAAKPRAPRARAITEAAELEDGFIAQPPSLLYKCVSAGVDAWEGGRRPQRALSRGPGFATPRGAPHTAFLAERSESRTRRPPRSPPLTL